MNKHVHFFDSIEPILSKFEDELNEGRRPAIEAFLPDDQSLRQRTLIELVHTDLEFRIAAGEGITAADYFASFPELAESSSIAADLVVTEFRCRRRAAGVKEEDFFARYSSLRSELLVRLGSINEPKTMGADRRGRYRLGPVIGQGVYGVVHLGHDEWLNRVIAIKILSDRSHEAKNRFLHEARRAASLHHPGIVPVFDFGYGDHGCYLVMEFVSGGSLEDVLRVHGPFSHHIAAQLVASLSDATHYAHSQNLIHRDIKPANVLMDPSGRPRLTDFGLAVGLRGDQAPAGTPAFMAPEQHHGQFDCQSDVYALGKLLITLITHETFKEFALPASISNELRAIIQKATWFEPSGRYSTAQALCDDLHRFLNGQSVLAKPENILERVFRRTRAEPWAALFIATLVFATIGFFGLWQNAELNRKKADDTSRIARESLSGLSESISSLDSTGDLDFCCADNVVLLVKRWEEYIALHPNDDEAARNLALAKITAAEREALFGRYEVSRIYAQSAWEWFSKNAPDDYSAGRAGMIYAKRLAYSGKKENTLEVLKSIRERASQHPNDPQWWVVSIDAATFQYRLQATEIPEAGRAPDLSTYTNQYISCIYASAGLLARDFSDVSNRLRVKADHVLSENHDNCSIRQHWDRAAALTSLGESAFSRQSLQASELLATAVKEWDIVKPTDPTGLWLSAYSRVLLAQVNTDPVIHNDAVKTLFAVIPFFERWANTSHASREHRYRLALCYRSMAKLWNDRLQGRRLDWYEKALVTLNGLTQDYPDDIEYQSMKALTLHRIAVCHRLAGQVTKAIEHLEQSIVIHKALSSGALDSQKYTKALGRDYEEMKRLSSMFK